MQAVVTFFYKIIIGCKLVVDDCGVYINGKKKSDGRPNWVVDLDPFEPVSAIVM